MSFWKEHQITSKNLRKSSGKNFIYTQYSNSYSKGTTVKTNDRRTSQQLKDDFKHRSTVFTASLLTAFDFQSVSGGYSLFTNIYVVKYVSKVRIFLSSSWGA